MRWGRCKRVNSETSFMYQPSETELRARLTGFIEKQTDGPVTVGELTRYSVGFSWLTYGFEATWEEGGKSQHRKLIARIGPPDGVFGPYSAVPQFVALKALEHSGVPVPRVYWFSDSPEVLGAPFFLMEKVEGEAPLPWVPGGGAAFDDTTRAALGEQFVAGLARLDEPGVLGEAAGIDDERDAVGAGQRARRPNVRHAHRLAAAGIVGHCHHHGRDAGSTNLLDRRAQRIHIHVALERIVQFRILRLDAGQIARLRTLPLDVRARGIEVRVARNHLARIRDGRKQDVLGGATLVSRNHVLEPGHILNRVLEPVER